MTLTLTCHVANSTRCRLWIASLAIIFGLTSHVDATGETSNVANLSEKPGRALIDVSIETSRSQPTAGDGLGVSADIKNISDSVVHIEGKEINLVLPPELEGPGKQSYGAYGLLPTEPEGPQGDPWKAGVDLNPGDSYKVFWTRGASRLTPEELDRQWYTRRIYNVIVSQMNFIFFPPGDYKIAVVCKYRPISASGTNSNMISSRTTAQTAVIHVAAPQFVILFGAALGGLLAYFILPQARKKLVQSMPTNEGPIARLVNRILKELAGIAGAILLSTMVTILLSRISETQFLIKVTITDIWGAIAIGFIANYVGAKALDKILSGFGDDPDKLAASEARKRMDSSPAQPSSAARSTT